MSAQDANLGSESVTVDGEEKSEERSTGVNDDINWQVKWGTTNTRKQLNCPTILSFITLPGAVEPIEWAAQHKPTHTHTFAVSGDGVFIFLFAAN